jgi:hypothetical protein
MVELLSTNLLFGLVSAYFVWVSRDDQMELTFPPLEQILL